MDLTQCVNVDGASTPLSNGLDKAGLDMEVEKAWCSAREKEWDFVHYFVVVPYNYLAPRVKKPP
jgi:hypothetical protein